MHDDALERQLRTALRTEVDNLTLTITTAEMERRLVLRRRGRSSRVPLVLVAALVGLAFAGTAFVAGGWRDQNSVVVPPVVPTDSASPTPAASPPGTIALPSNGPASPSANVSFGPLAVIRPSDGSDTALTNGTLRVTKDCVLLKTDSGRELLVWPADRTTWDAETERVGFTNFDGTIVRVGDGTRVSVGGSGSSNAEDGTTSRAWLSQMPWVQRPADSCPLKSRWFVGGLERAGS